MASCRLDANQGSEPASIGASSGGGRQGQAGRDAKYWLSMSDRV